LDALTTATESELVKRLQQGGRAAFEELLDRYERRIYNLALRLLDGHRAEAEDAAQDIFLEVHRSISRFRGDSRLDTWIHRIAVNVCLQRRRKRKLSTVELKDADGVHSPDGDPILSAQSAVKSLPDGQREVVLLHGMQGLSYSEVAEVLACPVGTVKSRLSTAFRRLRETLTPYVNGDPTLGPAVVEAGK